MKNIIGSLTFVLITLNIAWSQFDPLQLNNALVVAQQDKLEDQYTLELAMVELLRSNDINAKASLNIIRQGQDPIVLASDSVQRKLSNAGIDTYMLISVRGYDKRFNPSSNIQNLSDELRAGHLFQLWRETASSVSFTILFYRNGIPVYYDLVRVRAGGSKDAMMKRLMKKLDKKIKKSWK